MLASPHGSMEKHEEVRPLDPPDWPRGGRGADSNTDEKQRGLGSIWRLWPPEGTLVS